MLRTATLSIIAGAAALLLAAAPAGATKKKPLQKQPETTESKQQRASASYRRGPQVRGGVEAAVLRPRLVPCGRVQLAARPARRRVRGRSVDKVA